MKNQEFQETYKERYRDLEDLLYKGFLSLKVKIHDIDFVFKTISVEEHDLILLNGH